MWLGFNVNIISHTVYSDEVINDTTRGSGAGASALESWYIAYRHFALESSEISASIAVGATGCRIRRVGIRTYLVGP